MARLLAFFNLPMPFLMEYNQFFRIQLDFGAFVSHKMHTPETSKSTNYSRHYYWSSKRLTSITLHTHINLYIYLHFIKNIDIKYIILAQWIMFSLRWPKWVIGSALRSTGSRAASRVMCRTLWPIRPMLGSVDPLWLLSTLKCVACLESGVL